jgi:hypothetical protein
MKAFLSQDIVVTAPCLEKDHLFTVFYQVYCALFYIENIAEIFPAHYTWKVAEKGFTMSLMTNKDAVVDSCKNKIFFPKNHFEIQERTIIVCTLYSIKYSNSCS